MIEPAERMAELTEWPVSTAGPVPLESAKLADTRGCRKSFRLDSRNRLSRKDYGTSISMDRDFERQRRWRKATGRVPRCIFSSLLFSTELVAQGFRDK